jgi:hypothetical protein
MRSFALRERVVDDILGGCPLHRRDARMQRRHPSAQPTRQQLFDLRQCPQRRFLHAADGRPRGVAQADSHRDGFVIVEHQGRHMRPYCQAIAPFGSRRGIDGIAKFAQPIDVTPNRSLRDLEAFSEFSSPPQTVSLKEREQLERPAGGIFRHFPSVSPIEDRFCPQGSLR